MKFSPLLVLSFVYTAVAITAAMSPLNVMLARAVNYGAFTAEELANTDVESRCCCRPPPDITNVTTLHRIIEASQKVKREFDFSMFSEEEKANTDAETCCCCIPPGTNPNAAVLHRIIAATT